MKIKLITILATIWAAVIIASAQSQVVVEAVMDSSVLWVGEQTKISLSLTQDADKHVIFPEIEVGSQLVDGVEVLDISQPDTVKMKNNRLNIRQEVLVTSFDSGFYYIPPFRYVIDQDTFETTSLSLKIVPVSIADDAVASDAYDIKGVEEPPFKILDFIPRWVIWVILILAIIAVVAYILLRYFKPQAVGVVSVVVPPVPPYERAIKELQELRDLKLWQQGQDKLYYTRLVDILREYIDGRFDINAMEMTSSEIISALARNKDTREVHKYLNEVLSMADFVKFAKMRPMPDDNEQALRRAYDFVELTKPQPQPSQESDDVTSEKE